MVNYKRVVCEVGLLLLLATLAAAAPAPDCTEKHYDQRQNGTANYRLNIDDVVIAVSPPKDLTDAVSDFDIYDLMYLSYFFPHRPKPTPIPDITEYYPDYEYLMPEDAKPEDEKPEAEKPEAQKPEAEKPKAEKPQADKPEAEKPEAEKPKAEKPLDLTPSSEPVKSKSHRTNATVRKQEKAQRLKQRLANVLLPLLRKNGHQ